MQWNLIPGDTIARKQLHNHFGGNRQGGISPSRTTPNIFVFTDPASGQRHGYFDEWDGNALHYAGEGQSGDQQFTVGNKALRDHTDAGRAIRVFQGAKGTVTYLGEFELGDPPHYYEDAPSTGGGPTRKVIKFVLKPVRGTAAVAQAKANLEVGVPYRPARAPTASLQPEPFEVDPEVLDRGRRGHVDTQNALADFLRANELDPLTPGALDPEFDLAWLLNGILYVTEVKSLTARNEVRRLRLGLGQVLDYAAILTREGRKVRPVLAVEREPSSDRWLALCDQHEVALVWPATFDAFLSKLLRDG